MLRASGRPLLVLLVLGCARPGAGSDAATQSSSAPARAPRVPFCGGPVDAPTCADPALVCARTDRLWPISVCVPPCDPLAYDCPDADIGAVAMVCQPAALGFGCVLRGNLDGRALGEPCVQHRDCTAAAHCAPPDDVPGCAGPEGCCAAYCDLDAASCPVAGQTCVAHFAPGEAPPNLEKVGRCAVP
ncbi:hypothetical protein [Nannocystis pusilla]|uniref:Uncharacterized protein n=1 Tax=Nannocystis pusilla TaxID=889268 RepID=A0ABS7U5K8_9BACT|nr:hypothetical protein [Nannocystis pusilla]MBZ5715844.1 hypothetical protein [Nannocystis pusilla]